MPHSRNNSRGEKPHLGAVLPDIGSGECTVDFQIQWRD
jgi:hypothetical protein